MNKSIFQIGILSFCVSVVVHTTEHVGLMQAIYRSFVVFIGVVVICAILVTMNVLMLANAKRKHSSGEENISIHGKASGRVTDPD